MLSKLTTATLTSSANRRHVCHERLQGVNTAAQGVCLHHNRHLHVPSNPNQYHPSQCALFR
jgi:hypothetical protein